MSRYRFLSAHFIGNRYYAAGEVASTRDVIGGSLPLNWPPTPASDPLGRERCCRFLVGWSLGGKSDRFIRCPARNLLRSRSGHRDAQSALCADGTAWRRVREQAGLFVMTSFPEFRD